MSDRPADLVLELFRAIWGDVSEIRGDISEIKERLRVIEGQSGSLSRRFDRLGGAFEHIKRRLDIVPA